MPRITLPRILFLAPLFYLLLILLWVVLPSPDVPWGTDIADKTEERLWRGGSVTRVFKVDDFFPYTDPTPSVIEARTSQCDFFALTFAYDAHTGGLTISGPYSSQAIDITALLAVATSRENNDGSYISEPVSLQAKNGDHDGINLPWFNPADAALLYWEIHKDVITVPLRVRIFAGRNVQVVPDGEAWAEPDDTQRQNKITPLLSLIIDQTHAQRGLRYALWPALDIKPNSSPSWTFSIRRAIQAVLVPSYFFLDKVVFPVIEASAKMLAGAIYLTFWMTFLYVVVVLACWKASGTGAFWPWTRTFWMTRALVRYLGARISPSRLGTAGGKGELDANEGEMSDAANAAEVTSRGGPTPLTSPWAFFASSSPLDDLFVTFEVTKPLVQPIGLRRRRTGDLEGQPVESASSAITKEVYYDKDGGEGSTPLA